MPCAPVICRQRARSAAAGASSSSVAVMASRIGWSSALRLSGFEIVRRTTPSAGSSTSSLPPASSRGCALEATAADTSRARPNGDLAIGFAMKAGALPGRRARLLEHDERVALVDGLALLAADLHDGARVFGLDRHLHLHRLEDRHGVALLDLVADGALDFPYRPGDMGLDLSHGSAQ